MSSRPLDLTLVKMIEALNQRQGRLVPIKEIAQAIGLTPMKMSNIKSKRKPDKEIVLKLKAYAEANHLPFVYPEELL
ncbi:hypothetical protein [Gallibacterium sp. ZY190522]